ECRQTAGPPRPLVPPSCPFGASPPLVSPRDRASTGGPPMAWTTSESTADFPRGQRVRVRQDQSVGPAGTRIEVLEPAGHPSGGSHTASASESVSLSPVSAPALGGRCAAVESRRTTAGTKRRPRRRLTASRRPTAPSTRRL